MFSSKSKIEGSSQVKSSSAKTNEGMQLRKSLKYLEAYAYLQFWSTDVS